jgi:capsular polysaccharide biosynthesis protein
VAASAVNSLSNIFKRLLKYSVIGFILGALLAAGIYIILFMVNNTIKEEQDVEGYLGLPVLGRIPSIKGTRKLVEKGRRNKKLRLTQYSA